MMPERHLILGGARSGKTNHAITLATRLADVHGAPVVYVATAQALDDEMRDRIDRHRAQRPASWQTLEAPSQLAIALSVQAPAILLVDCLTLWLSNALLLDFDEAAPTAPVWSWDEERTAFLQWLAQYRGVVLLVSNEVGSGIVPASPPGPRVHAEPGRFENDV
jgi:adenosylcobinamide kinase / adenosylcobinamide-phosphate guanylyltransferase